jgi:hypothetical protein
MIRTVVPIDYAMISRPPVDPTLGPKPSLPYVAYRLKCGYLAATCGFHN